MMREISKRGLCFFQPPRANQVLPGSAHQTPYPRLIMYASEVKLGGKTLAPPCLWAAMGSIGQMHPRSPRLPEFSDRWSPMGCTDGHGDYLHLI